MKIEITDEKKALKYLPAMVNLLRSIPRPRFNLRSWAQTVEKTNEVPCGATACAIGYAALNPFFARTNLRLGEATYGILREYASCPLNHGCGGDEFYNIGLQYGISYEIASRYFDPYEYPDFGRETTPRAVAIRIERDLISTVGKKKYLAALKATKHVKYKPPTKAQLKKVGLWRE